METKLPKTIAKALETLQDYLDEDKCLDVAEAMAISEQLGELAEAYEEKSD